MYIMGENPAMSDPDANHAREALAALDHLVVQDIFLTETAYLADVILPASAFPEKTGTFTNTDRLVQMGRQAIDPPGEARQDLWIIQQMAQRLGLPTGSYGHVSEVFDEMRHTMPSIAGITWDRLEREHAVTYPCTQRRRPGPAGGVHRRLPARGRHGALRAGRHHPGRRAPRRRVPDGADHRPPARALAHRQHDAARRRVLDAIEPDPVALVHPLDLAAMGGRPGDVVTIESRRGEVVAVCAGRRQLAARRGVRAVLLLRSGDQPADQRRARPVRQDPRVQVLRGPLSLGGTRRRRAASAAARCWPGR